MSNSVLTQIENTFSQLSVYLSIDAINRLPLVITVVVGTKGGEHFSRLSDQCSRACGGKRVADRDSILMLPDSVT